jgi:hypothetical protein
MRDRRVRAAFVALILVFPILMTAMGARRSVPRSTVGTLLAVEGILAGGLLAAASERRRLRVERPRMSHRRGAPSLPHVGAGAVSRTSVR